MSLFSENSNFVDSLDMSGVSAPVFGFPLGSNGKSTATPINKELQSFPEKSVYAENLISEEFIKDEKKIRLDRFKLQSSVYKLLPYSSTAKCLRFRQDKQTEVAVFRSKKYGTTHYKGLQTCSSVWACPVCSAKISERRRLEVLDAITQHKENDKEVLLLTLTNPHTKNDDLKLMAKAQSKAMGLFTGCRAVRSIYSNIGYIGGIRAWEVTHGEANGWHPHFHILLFVDSGVDTDDLQNKLYKQWSNACDLSGLDKPSIEHGVKVDKGDKAADYVAKWGLDYEVTKGHIKKAKGKGRTPFDLLRMYSNDNDAHAGALFVEFVTAFSGKRQLYWSAGLKDFFDINDLKDKEVTSEEENEDEDVEWMGSFTPAGWKFILKNDLRGEVLELARDSWESVEMMLVAFSHGENTEHLTY